MIKLVEIEPGISYPVAMATTRMPAKLRDALKAEAKAAGVSLNLLCVAKLNTVAGSVELERARELMTPNSRQTRKPIEQASG